jgi:hypothetical protein
VVGILLVVPAATSTILVLLLRAGMIAHIATVDGLLDGSDGEALAINLVLVVLFEEAAATHVG